MTIAPLEGRGRGFEPDPPGIMHPPPEELFGQLRHSEHELDDPDHRPFRGPRIYQGRAGACVEFAMTRSRQNYFASRDIEMPLGAPAFGYWNARRRALVARYLDIPRDDGTVGVDLDSLPLPEDTGCQPLNLLKAEAELGFIPWEKYPYSDDPAFIKQQPPGDLYVDAYSQRGLRYARIEAFGPDRLVVAEAAMRRCLPVKFGIQVDHAYEEHFGEAPIASIDRGDILGGHMQTVARIWKPIVQGFPAMPKLVQVDNWWRDWGFDGYGILTEELFCSELVSHVSIIEHVPPFV
jgi:hypothetical protein